MTHVEAKEFIKIQLNGKIQEVQKGLAQLDRGEFIEHDEVVARIERMFRP